jgi:cell division septation protein DedD
VPVSAAALFAATQLKSFTTEPLSNAGMLSSVISRFSSSSLVDKKHAPAVAPEPIVIPDEPYYEEVVEETLPVDSPYAIIIGAFRVEENAMKAVEEALQAGFEDASLFDRSPSGLYRVCMGTFSTLEEAEDAMNTAQAGGYPGAWLLEK